MGFSCGTLVLAVVPLPCTPLRLRATVRVTYTYLTPGGGIGTATFDYLAHHVWSTGGRLL